MQPVNFPPQNEDSFLIRDVWSSNLDQEFDIIRDIVDDYPYIAMDTEFPGIVHHSAGNGPKSSHNLDYNTIRANVNALKLIQLGLAFSDEHGHHPSDGGGDTSQKLIVWQFNFREFNIEEDLHSPKSIELLKESGIDFRRNVRDGIDVRRFGELLMSSGLVLNDAVQWVTFHSGYDFGYLIKLLTGRNLPGTEKEFFKLINVFCPRVYDVKYMMKFCNNVFGGLSVLGDILGIKRIGTSHQAGSDSLLTCNVFFKLRDRYFTGSLEKYEGVIYGLGIDKQPSRS